MPEQMWMHKNDKWKEYEIAIDKKEKCIVLLGLEKEKENDGKIEKIQIGEKSENENENENETTLNVEIEWWNDFSELATNEDKWCGVTINHSWRFRTLSWMDRLQFHEQCTVKM